MACVSGGGYHFALKLQPEILSVLYIGLLYMPTPFYALLITSKITKEPLRLQQYGTLHGLTGRGVAATIALFVAWILIFSVGTLILSQLAPQVVGEFAANTDDVRRNIAEVVGGEAAASANLPGNIIFLVISAFIAAVISGFSINLLFALAEEYGWRGYLNKRLHLGFIKRHFVIGVLWGLWHTPLILQGYNYGDGYELWGTAVFILCTITIGMILGLLVERFNNILYAGAFHGMFNGFVGVFPFLLGSYNPLIGGPVGLIAAISFLVLLLFTQVIKPLRVSG